MALSSEIIEFWRRNALDNIIPFREGNEFPDGQLALDTLRDFVGDGRVVEFGCGRGRLAPLFAKELYHGVDISSPAIRAAKKTNKDYRFSLIQPQDALPKADVVFAYTVLHHIPQVDCLDAVMRMCQSAKRVVVAEVMDIRFGHDMMPPCINRDIAEYRAMFAENSYALTQKKTIKYDAYSDRLMTVAEFC